MERRLMKKREKCRKQNMKKRPSTHSSNSDSSSCSTLGSPSLPPPSLVWCNQNILSSADSKLLGKDEAVFTYEVDEENGQHVVGDELISYLRQSNKKLAQTAKLYLNVVSMKSMRSMKQKQNMKKKLEKYENSMYYLNNRCAAMLKMALTKGSI